MAQSVFRNFNFFGFYWIFGIFGTLPCLEVKSRPLPNRNFMVSMC